jgi:hypothetical protein
MPPMLSCRYFWYMVFCIHKQIWCKRWDVNLILFTDISMESIKNSCCRCQTTLLSMSFWNHSANLLASQFSLPQISRSSYGSLSSWYSLTHLKWCQRVDAFMCNPQTWSQCQYHCCTASSMNVVPGFSFTQEIAAWLLTHFTILLIDLIL